MSIKLLGVVATVLVTGLVVTGLFVAGSPNTARNIRTDQETEGRLSELHYRLVDYEQTNGRLPKSLAELGSNDFRPRFRDEDETPIDYRRISDHEYEMCAVFLTSSYDRRRTGYYSSGDDSFAHGEGRVCFRRKTQSRAIVNNPKVRVRPVPPPVPID